MTPSVLLCFTGCLTLDIALGGGWPRGRICEIFGQESTGKTTLALHAIAEAQKLGGQAVLIDAEHAFNKEFARKIGVDIEVSASRTRGSEHTGSYQAELMLQHVLYGCLDVCNPQTLILTYICRG